MKPICIRKLIKLAAVFFIFLGPAGVCRAERLPVRQYTAADGLAMDQVLVIRQDSRRLLWFGTSDGLCWFDGTSFTRLTTEDGLPDRYVTDILETRAGELWLATGDGLCRFNGNRLPDPAGQLLPRIEVFKPPADANKPDSSVINSMTEAPDGSLWVGTNWRLYRFFRKEGRWQFREIEIGLESLRPGNGRAIKQLLLDRTGALWMAFDSGLHRLLPDGRVVCYEITEGMPVCPYFKLVLDTRGWVWASSSQGVYAFDINFRPASPPLVWQLHSGAGQPGLWVRALLAGHDGRVWAGSASGLTVMDPDRGPAFNRTFIKENGLLDINLLCLAEDDERNIWVGTENSGALRISPRGFQLFDQSDGLAMNKCMAIFLDQQGNPGFFTREFSTAFFGFDGRRFFPVPLPGTETIGWVDKQLMLQDHLGEWWLATGNKGLWRYARSGSLAGLAGRRPQRIYNRRNGLPGDEVFSVFEDSRGDIWISIFNPRLVLVRWDRRREFFVPVNGLRNLPICFGEDRSGAVWAGLYGNGVLRLRAGRMESFSPEDGVPDGWISCLHCDRQGRLWIGSSQEGAACVDDPASVRPVFRRYGKKDGLSSNIIRSITEDHWGRIYFTTANGVDRLDPVSGLIKHFGAADGLASGFVMTSRTGRDGNLWFGSHHGLFRYIPGPEIIRKPPSIFITGLRFGGNAQPLAEWGQREVSSTEVPSSQNRLEIEFSGISFAPGDKLGFRYRLTGLDDRWHQIPARRTIDYMNIRPGDYRLEIQAINSDGLASSPATVTFTVLTPVWRRGWFISLMLLTAATLIYMLIRIRVKRRLELERIRIRIATDLHDDIGSSLSQISILSEVALRQPAGPGQSVQEPLKRIANTARELVDAMSDIVWAINPERDRLSDLVYRMRRFAADLFTEGNIACRFQAPGPEIQLPLGADFRRHVYLIFKECLHNLVRHAGANHADISIHLQPGSLELEIQDDGRGFDPAAPASGGQGLASIQRRALELGGELAVISQPGHGTRVRLRVPVSRPFRRHS